jgi:hypothetical protein
MYSFVIAAASIVSSWTHVLANETWRPSVSTMSALRAELKNQVQTAAAAEREKLPDWKKYRFQYQGQTIGGKQVVFVNAYCWLDTEMSEEAFFSISDGGACFFTTTFDPQSERFSTIVFHGHG